MNEAPLVIILMGSKADLDHCKKIAQVVGEFGIETVLRVGSAHKTAQHTLEILRGFEASPRPKVYITVAGRSNALSGFTDGFVTAPVIACPPPSDAFGGADVYSSLRMPSGVAPALVLEPANAALLAAKILACSNPALQEAVRRYHQKQADKIIQDDQELNP